MRLGARFKLASSLSLLFAASLHAELQPIHEIREPAGHFDPAKFGKVAVLQWAPALPTPLGVTVEVAERFKQENRETVARFVREAAGNGAKMVITPEFALVGYPDIPELPPEEDEFRNVDDITPYGESVPGPSTEYFGALAKELGIYLHIGFAEKITDAQGVVHFYNVVVALGPEGQILAKYHKINLYQGEHNFLVAGERPATYQSPFGKVGFLICADVYSDIPMENYRRQGVQLLALSTSWANWNSGMKNFRRGARWVGAHLLAANQPYFPDSGVVNPDGSTQSHIRQSNGLAYGYIPYIKK